MISVETLLNLVSIVEQGSFSSAAEILNQTPSAVSRALSRLEGQLSVLIDLRLSKGYLYWISGVQPLNNINQQPT